MKEFQNESLKKEDQNVCLNRKQKRELSAVVRSKEDEKKTRGAKIFL